MKINALQIKCAALNYLAFQLIKVVKSEETFSQVNNSGACPLILRTRSTRMDGYENSFGSPPKILRLTKNRVGAYKYIKYILFFS
jgi:hypothetical protein